jgi:hypothetical protein
VGLKGIRLPDLGDASTATRTFAVLFNKHISEQMKLLLEQKHLYQNVSVDPEPIQKEVLGRSIGNIRTALEATIRRLLVDRLRPSTTEQFATAADNIRQEYIEIMLVLPSVRWYCTACKERSVFRPIWHQDLANESVKLATHQGLEFPTRELLSNQTFVVAFQCQHCKGLPETILIRREGWKFYLEGRSPMEHLDLPKYIPKAEAHLFRDALIAANAGKRLAAVFYLRCFIEQFARRQSGLLKLKKTGDEIMDAYAKILPDDKRSHLPSLKHLYDALSVPIHAADEQMAEQIFENAKTDSEHHFELRQALRIQESNPPKA